MNLPWRKPEPMPMTLADEVFALIGSYDASKAQRLSDLREIRKRLYGLASHTLTAMAEIDALLHREDGASTDEKIEANIEQAFKNIDLSDAPPSSSKRKKGAA